MADSMWKKEISFKRKAKETTPEPAEAVEPAEPAAAPSGDAPFWKKEISFSRKPKAEKAPKPPKAPKEQKPPKPPKAEKPDAGDGVPFWKKEISLSRKPKTADAVADVSVVEPEPAAEPESDQSDEPLTDVAERIAPWVAAAADAAARAQAPDAEPEAQPQPQPEAQVAAEAASVVDAPTIEVPADDAWTQDAELPPEPVAPVVETPEPVAAAGPITPRTPVNPPVPAAELPPLADEEKKPFWKRELGRKKADKPADEAKPDRKPEKVKREKPAKGEKPPKVKKERGAKRDGVPKRLVGLKVGASQLAAARIANNGSAELVQFARDELEPGVVVGGELRDPEALSAALKEFFSKHKLPRTGVRLGIANNRIGVRTFEIVGIDDGKQLANAIKFRAQEALPIPIEEAVLDYHILSETQNEEGQLVRRVLLVVAYRDLIDRYVDACRKAGVRLVGIDLEAFALLRALAPPQDGAGGDANAALVAVSIGHDRSTFAVSDGRTCEFTRVLEWGGAAVNVALARELNAAPSEVEDLKRSLSLLDESIPEGLTAEQATTARDAARKQVQAFARELVSSLQFYQSQPGSLGIGEIVLTGGTAHLHGLAEELQRLIGVRVRIGDPLARLKLPKKFEDPDQIGSLAIAIGLGIED